MKYVAVDTETALMEPGICAPALVCLSSYEENANGEGVGVLRNAADAIVWFRKQITDPDVTLIGHNTAFDMSVLCVRDPSLLPLVFRAVDDGRVRDTMITQMLLDIGKGTFEYRVNSDGKRVPAQRSLAALVKHWFGTVIDKGGDTWRKKYASLAHLPVEKYPPNAVTYAIDDAKWTYKLAMKLMDECGERPPTEVLQIKTAWCFQLMRIYGVRTDPDVVEQCYQNWSARKARAAVVLTKAGMLTSEGTLDQATLAAYIEDACAARDLPLTHTATGKVCTNKEVITDIVVKTGGRAEETEQDEDEPEQKGDPVFLSYRRYKRYEKLLSNYLPRMRQATRIPFNPSWNVLVSSGRTSCGSPDDPGNLQNLPRSGPVRECYSPRAGSLFCSTDLEAAELASLAEIMLVLGFESPLADEIIAGLDPHMSLAVNELLLNEDGTPRYTYEYAMANKKQKDIKEARQFAKIVDFGKPGGQGDEGICHFAKTAYRTVMTLEQAHDMGQRWLNHYKMQPFFRWVSRKTQNGRVTLAHPITGFVRADMRYTELANFLFQNLTSCVAKDGLWRITMECYLGCSVDGKYKLGESPLYGSRPVMFVHDEVVCEVPEAKAHEAAMRQAELMTQGGNEYIKRVPSRCEAAIAKRLYKDMSPVFDANDRLIPWEPKKS